MEDKEVLENLRSKTLELISQSPKRIGKDFSCFSQEELLEELNNYHIELSAQNHELQAINKRLEDTTHIFNALFYNAPVGYLLLDSKYKFIEVNSKALEILNIKKINFNTLRLVNYIGKGEVQSFLDWSVNKKVSSIELDLRIGSHIKKVFMQKAYWQSNTEFIFLTLEDITEKKSQEKIAFEKNKIDTIISMLNQIIHYWTQPLTVISLLFDSFILHIKNKTLDLKSLEKKSLKGVSLVKELSSSLREVKSLLYMNENNFENFNIKKSLFEIIATFESTYQSSEIICDIKDFYIHSSEEKFIYSIEELLKICLLSNLKKGKKSIFISSREDETNYTLSIKTEGILKEELNFENLNYFVDLESDDFISANMNVVRIVIEGILLGVLNIKKNNNTLEFDILFRKKDERK